jgi:hypothetical protein
MEREIDGAKDVAPTLVLSKNMILCYAGNASEKWQQA